MTYEDFESQLNRSATIINDQEDLHATLELVQYVIEFSAESTPHNGKFANSTAALASLTRAFHDAQGIMHLAAFHHYVQALALLRSMYEAANLSRTLAHSPKSAEKWINGRWQSDQRTRQFVRDVMYADSEDKDKEEAVQAYENVYKLYSKWTHITPTSALEPYLTDVPEGGYRVQLFPKFDEARLRFVLEGLTKESIVLAFAARNCLSALEVLPEWWHRDLEKIKMRVMGDDYEPSNIEWEGHQERHDRLLKNLQPISILDRHLRRDPDSIQNRMHRGPDN